MEFSQAQNLALEFRNDRDWKQFHNPKDLAISISLESAELLELFQWSGSDTSIGNKLPQAKEELADVLIYCIYMANELGVDVGEIIAEKIKKNAAHYPVDKARGSSKKYTDL